MVDNGVWRIVVVGMGFAGSATAVALLRSWTGGPLALDLIERSGRYGSGVAYATPYSDHLLNVPAAAMSLLENRPGDFLEWTGQHRPGTSPRCFVPRRDFGRYVRDRLAEAERDARSGGVSVGRRHDTAVDVLPGRCPTLVTATGERLRADAVVLALGLPAPAHPPGLSPALRDHPRYVADPCDWAQLERLAGSRRVLVVGTGLTMVDVALALRAGERAGPQLLAVSRHGLLPRAHRTVPGSAGSAPALGRVRTADELAARIETAMRSASAAGGDWRAVVDGLRPQAQQLWRALPPVERRRLVEHHGRRWDVHRHRMAPEIADRLRWLRRSGSVQVRDASVIALEPAGAGAIAATLASPRGEERVVVDGLVNATGPAFDPRRSPDPLLRSLLRRGLAAPGPLRMGLATDGDGALLDASGARSPGLYTLGALRRGELWETTAVPEIRAQAAAIASALARRTPAALVGA
jgi:uncharacterized NAD(P)/FAD-binding protein YdhS